MESYFIPMNLYTHDFFFPQPHNKHGYNHSLITIKLNFNVTVVFIKVCTHVGSTQKTQSNLLKKLKIMGWAR